tara:strand:- start:210 stop:386 length:177 start_codon:yes stop_codon:yes gene_type:complete
MGYFKQLHYELNNTDQKGRHIPTTSMKEGQEWFNQRNKKMYVVKNGKLILKKGDKNAS